MHIPASNKSSQRLALRLALIAVILFSAVAIAGFGSPRKALAASAITTSTLNLRAGPSTGNFVKLVMPANASVDLLSGVGNAGFYKVSYNGLLGYAYADYLSVGGSGSNSIDAGWGNDGAARTTSALNLRSGPGTGYGIADVMPSGASVTLTGASQSGFLGVIYNGGNGWASADYLAAGSGYSNSDDGGNSGTAYTISNLNLRSGPSIGYGVLVVLPSGAKVSLTGEVQDGFAKLTYSGTTGWAAQSYLSDTKPTSGNSGNTSTGDSVVDIIYAAADKYGQNRAALLAVAQCESGLNPNSVNQYSNASGLFQFLPGTWATTPYAADNIFDPVANAEAAAWMWSVGRRGEWVC